MFDRVDATSFGSVGSAGALELTAAGVPEEMPEAAPEVPEERKRPVSVVFFFFFWVRFLPSTQVYP